MKKLTNSEKIMVDFVDRTCIAGDSCQPVRYLWTDAFAVCNFLELFNWTGEEKYKRYALQLVDQVHHVLGRYREDDSIWDLKRWKRALKNQPTAFLFPLLSLPF